MINKKCPICGGNLEVVDDQFNAICDSCGEKFSLSELNNRKLKNNKSTLFEDEEETKQGHKSAFADSDEITKLSDKKIIEQINLALETANWYLARMYCNEMIRRDPTNASAYLFRILATLKLSKKEDIPSLGFPLDKVSYNSVEEDYKLFLKFADSELKQEIVFYNNQIKEKLKKEELEQDLEDERIAKARKEEYKKEKRKEGLKIFISLAIIAIIIIIIVFSVSNKKSQDNELYKSSNFKVEVTSKINDEYDSYSKLYTYTFKFRVTNNSEQGITYLVGYMIVRDINNNDLVQCEVSLTGSLASGSSGNWKVQVNNHDMDTGLTLWNTDYEELNILFRISEIHFNDNTFKTYDNKDELIKSANINYKENQYQHAISLYEQGNYTEAIEIFKYLGDYKASENYLQQSNTALDNQIWLQKINNILTAQKGSEVICGSYEQDDNVDNGHEDVEWIVLDNQDNKLILISKYCLDYYQFDGNYLDGETIWATSDLRNWLNSTFYNNAFSSKEKNLISTSVVSPTSSEQENGGTETNDKVYIFSAEEVTNYFPDQSDRSCSLTNYAYNLYNTWGVSSANWWVRTPASTYKEQFIDSYGFIDTTGSAVEDVRAIRPVICIDLSAIAS